jgi:hypothetical protein
MKLTGKDVVFLHRAVYGGSVLRDSFDNLLVLCLQIIGMYIIHKGTLVNAVKQPPIIDKMKGIPADMRDF